MPELIEVEMYADAVRPLEGSSLQRIDLLDGAYLRPPGVPPSLLDRLLGSRLVAVRRHGKLMLLDFDGELGECVLGLRFGMTGRLLVGERGPIDALVYSTARDEAEWDRVRLHLDGSVVSVRDPRRLGSVELDPDVSGLGPDAARITTADLRRVLAGRTAPVKAALLNQRVIAGLGNLLVDEILWRVALAPTRSVDSLDAEATRRLARGIRSTIAALSRRGGSHTGDSFEVRTGGALCPLDGAPVCRDRIGGRTTYWCPTHQH